MIGHLDYLEVAILFAASTFLWAGANRYAGMEGGNRYVWPLINGAFFSVFFGLSSMFIALNFIFWRSFGWYNSVDMGRDAGSFLGDFVIMLCICTLLGIAPMFISGHILFMPLTGLLVASCYAFSMWVVPYNGKFKNIAIAEWSSGAVYGIIAFAAMR